MSGSAGFGKHGMDPLVSLDENIVLAACHTIQRMIVRTASLICVSDTDGSAVAGPLDGRTDVLDQHLLAGVPGAAGNRRADGLLVR